MNLARDATLKHLLSPTGRGLVKRCYCYCYYCHYHCDVYYFYYYYYYYS